MNRKERRAARKQGKCNPVRLDPDEFEGSSSLFPLALEHHRRGELTEAEDICRKLLRREPNHSDNLHLLGMVAHQTGRQELAIDLIGKAIALSPGIPIFHCNIGLALQALDRAEEAITHYERAVKLQPAWAAPHLLIGNALFQQGKLGEAADKYQRALGIEPGFVGAIYMLGNVLQLQGRVGEAIARYQRALTLRPDFAEVHNNLGNALRQEGRLDEAEAYCRRSLDLKADNPEALNNLALVLQQKGAIEEALEQYQQALSLRPDFLEVHQNICRALMSKGSMEQALRHACRALELRELSDAKALFVQCVRGIRDLTPIPILEVSTIQRQIIRALFEPWGRPGDLEYVCISLIKSDAAIKEIIERAKTSVKCAVEPVHLAAACENELLRCLLEVAPVGDLDLEKCLVAIRAAVLDLAATATIANRIEDNVLGFCCALARQCYVNEYIFACNDTELGRARRLRDALVAALEFGTPFPELWLAAVAAYFPLNSLPAAKSLLEMTCSEAVAKLVAQQVMEPQQEHAYRTSILRLTRIEDETSRAVQRQYEENPYPRWVKTARMGEPTTISSFLHQLFPMASSECLEGKDDAEILIAGCGTGQQSIEAAQKFPRARILAIDLSLASLCYAERKTRELGVKNIQYAQADILRFGDIGRKFDVIEATGVLHHLRNPIAGWRTLLTALRPAGFMRVGLYSKLARRNISMAQAFVARRGFRPSDLDIRRCRSELAELDDATMIQDLARTADFYSTSGCRDLLFSAQEQQMTLPEIDRFLTEHDLEFLGFGMESSILTQFRQRFPWNKAFADLKLWHTFEVENPSTFIRMYQFWVQKKSSGGGD